VLQVLSVDSITVTYGRPGLGGSEPLPVELRRSRPAGWAAAQLRTLLGRAGVPLVPDPGAAFDTVRW
jgi:hypothetical protein